MESPEPYGDGETQTTCNGLDEDDVSKTTHRSPLRKVTVD
jgi:hypothetical protein